MDDPPDAGLDAPVRALRAAAAAGLRAGVAPALLAVLVLLPVAIGLIGTLLPAFDYLPALGRASFGLSAWRELLSYPGVWASLRLSAGPSWMAIGQNLAGAGKNGIMACLSGSKVRAARCLDVTVLSESRGSR